MPDWLSDSDIAPVIKKANLIPIEFKTNVIAAGVAPKMKKKREINDEADNVEELMKAAPVKKSIVFPQLPKIMSR